MLRLINKLLKFFFNYKLVIIAVYVYNCKFIGKPILLAVYHFYLKRTFFERTKFTMGKTCIYSKNIEEYEKISQDNHNQPFVYIACKNFNFSQQKKIAKYFAEMCFNSKMLEECVFYFFIFYTPVHTSQKSAKILFELSIGI